MLQRLIAALLGLLGIAAAALGVASATIWRADDPLIATATSQTATLVTDPGVLEVAGDPVTVTVRAGDDPVVLAIGRQTDVDGWIGDDPYTRVTGLADWHDLATTTGEPVTEPTADATESADTAEPTTEETEAPADGDQAAAEVADPTGSDMWVAEVTGTGSASLEWRAPGSGRWSLIAVGLGETSPTLEMSWPQEVTTPWLWPGVGAGAVLLLISALLTIRMVRRRSARCSAAHAEDRAGSSQTPSSTTEPLQAVSAPDAVQPSASTRSRPAAPDPSTPRPEVPAPTSGTTSPAPAAASAPVPTAVAPTTTGSIPMIDGKPITRRQLREAEAAARRGRGLTTGTVPIVTGGLPAVTGQVPTTPPGAPVTSPGQAVPPSAAVPGAPADPVGRPAGAPAPVPPPSGTLPVALPGQVPPAGPTQGDPSTVVQPAVPGAPVAPPGPGPRSAPAPAGPTAAVAGPDQGSGERRSRLPWRRRKQQGDPAPAPGPPPAPGSFPAAAGPGVQEPAVPGVDDRDSEDSRAQRADAWRQMWGFPNDGTPDAGDGPPAQGGSTTQEEGR